MTGMVSVSIMFKVEMMTEVSANGMEVNVIASGVIVMTGWLSVTITVDGSRVT